MNSLSEIAVSRRSALKAGSLAALGLAGACSVGVATQVTVAEAAADETSFVPSFLVAPEAINEVSETKDYDVVVVGAGSAGMAAANRAAEEGARVAVVQKLAMASSQGFNAAGVSPAATDVQKAAFVSTLMSLCDLRPSRELLEAYANTSGEAIMWYRDLITRAGVELPAEEESTYVRDCNGYEVEFMTARPSGTHASAVIAIAEYAQANGVDFYYEMPGVQLVTEGGAVTGVIAGVEGSYVRFNAKKGVILATGDYQSNDEMIAFYCPDVLGFPPLAAQRDGDGHRMGVWAGGRIEPIGHTKMIHDLWMNAAPYLMVGPDGNRFCDEHIPWFKINTLMRPLMQGAYRDNPDFARIFSVVDSNYLAQAEAWAEFDSDISAKEVPGLDEMSLGTAELHITVTADTIEGLAEQMGVEVEALTATVERYNELVEKGADEDFGKDARFLAPIATPPFYAVQRDFNWGLSATLGGLVVDTNNQVLNADDEPIPGLYAAGNTSGPFFGGIDYPMTFGGLSIGRAVTTGYIAGSAAARA